MSCCEKLKYERLKELNHARILMVIEGNLTRTKMALVKKVHHLYGEHYIGVHYNDAIRDGLKIIMVHDPAKQVKKETSVKPAGNKKKSSTKRKSG